MKRIIRNLIIGTATTTAILSVSTFAIADFMVHLSIDKRCSGWMEKLMSHGAAADYLEAPHADASEEHEAAQWFAQAKQPVTTYSEDGLKLHGWLFDSDSSIPHSHLYAICMHGYTGTPAEMAKYARRFVRMGFTVLVPAQRCHELSEGRFVGMGWLERRDLMRWIHLIVESDPEAHILLDGISMGAATVMMAVGEPDLPRNVAAAIEDCGYSSVWDQFLYNAKGMYHLPRRWMAVPFVAAMSKISKHLAEYGFREASSVSSLHHATVPMMFIHGSDDTFVDPAFLDRNYAACASIDRERLLVPGAAHAMSASTQPELYWDRVTNFVKRTFKL
ncbi:alpha/beta hydrolase [Bifidobacterium imperatoris]|uniref:Alpha/beta hydrolase n=1 Tax=Bifidobacterium imperatoris TaxID=2020965 RepID=A0A2N5IQ78_9BIFI|nr:alpha/beta hydrolase [Bifidobacterium imperatoris]PLS24121.1 alpha/beta hydrolase [Bifidobacterium imperatoris]QSY57379.1 alpha/beta hydrolase [Bifidobacterium imperatoris]